MFLIDRQYNFRLVSHLHPSSPAPFMDTRPAGLCIVNLFDGELVDDKPWRKDSSAPIFLVFDSLVVNKQSVVGSAFHRRLTEAHKYVIERFLPARVLQSNPDAKLPCVDIYMKEMFHCWDAHQLFEKLLDSGKLEHDNDGLIFTVDECPYYPGTCEGIYKWKPIELNSIDFRLQRTDHSEVYRLLTADEVFFSYLVLPKPEADLYISKGGVVECVYQKTKDDDLQLRVNAALKSGATIS